MILQEELQSLFKMLSSLSGDALQFNARSLVSRLVVLAQAVLLRQYAPDFVSNAFIQTRYQAFHGQVVGTINADQIDVSRILDRVLAS